MTIEEAGATPGFHHQRDFLRPVTGEYLDPFDGRAISIARSSGSWIRRRSATTACACCAASSSLPASSARSSPQRALVRVDPARRPASRASLGRDREAVASGAAPSIGLRLALELGVVQRLFPEIAALVDCPQEPEWHPEGDVWDPYADGGGSGAQTYR
jgi:tRNA nucleotidyltransferase (CCA-adding enzyme)